MVILPTLDESPKEKWLYWSIRSTVASDTRDVFDVHFSSILRVSYVYICLRYLFILICAQNTR